MTKTLVAITLTLVVMLSLPYSGDSLVGQGLPHIQNASPAPQLLAQPPTSSALSPAGSATQINLDKAVGAFYTTVPRPLWDIILPIQGCDVPRYAPNCVTSHFGPRNDTQHRGTDIAATSGTAVLAVQDGVVTRAARTQDYGKMVEIDHGSNIKTRYAHLNSFPVSVGDIVKQGETIGMVGSTGNSTGPHLHLEIHINGDAKDPFLYFPFES